MDIEKANQEAVERMMEARPVLVGLGKAIDVIPGMKDNLLLHAGPPITWERASGPMRGAITGALIFEGKAKDMKEAQKLVESGEIELEPCHHHQSVGPMAGVTCSSMSVYILENTTHGNKSYSNLNEGYGKVLRYGAYSEEVIAKLRWMEDVMAPLLKEAIESSDGIDIRSLLAESLHMGDEGHNRNKAGSILFTLVSIPAIAWYVLRKKGETAKEPFVASGGEKIDTFASHIEIQCAYALNSVNVQVAIILMCQGRQSLQIVPVAILVGYPRDRYKSCALIHKLGEVFHASSTVNVLNDAQLNAASLRKVLIEDYRRVVVQIIDYNVVTSTQIQCRCDYVFAFTCRR